MEQQSQPPLPENDSHSNVTGFEYVRRAIASRVPILSSSAFLSARTSRAYYPSSPSDIYHTAFLLRRFLPADLIPQILDSAQHWLYTSVERKETVTVEQGRSPATYLQLRIPSTGLRFPVRKVRFVVRSHDQGWCSNRSNGNWTWFEARILEPRPREEGSLEEAEATDFVTTEGGNVLLVHNRMAKLEPATHTITWTREEGKEEEEREEWVRKGKEIVRELKAGSMVEVLACALFDGWINHVKEGKIEVFTACVR